VIFHPLDVQSEESSHNLAQWLSQNYGGIDILVSKTDFYGVTIVRNSIPQLFPIHADSWNFFLLVSERKSIYLELQNVEILTCRGEVMIEPYLIADE
jgi:hypothetical protein